jgi:hypothetical protein
LPYFANISVWQCERRGCCPFCHLSPSWKPVGSDWSASAWCSVYFFSFLGRVIYFIPPSGNVAWKKGNNLIITWLIWEVCRKWQHGWFFCIGQFSVALP